MKHPFPFPFFHPLYSHYSPPVGYLFSSCSIFIIPFCCIFCLFFPFPQSSMIISVIPSPSIPFFLKLVIYWIHSSFFLHLFRLHSILPTSSLLLNQLLKTTWGRLPLGR